MWDQQTFSFEGWFQKDPQGIHRKKIGLGDPNGNTSVVVDFGLMQVHLKDDPSEILYLARSEIGEEPTEAYYISGLLKREKMKKQREFDEDQKKQAKEAEQALAKN